VQVRYARGAGLRASVVLFAGLSLLPAEIAFGAAQQPGTRPSETDLDRVEVLLGRGKLDEAIGLLENLQRKNPPPTGIEAKLGKAYYKKRSFQPAIAHLKVALQKIPRIARPRNCWPVLLCRGPVGPGHPLLERIQSRLPATEFDGWYLLGVCYSELNNRTKLAQLSPTCFQCRRTAPPVICFLLR